MFPVLAWIQIACGFRVTLLVSGSLGLVSVFIDLALSYHWDITVRVAIVPNCAGLSLLWVPWLEG